MKMSANLKSKKSRNPLNYWGFGMVPVVGLEPTRCRHQRILSPSRLPIPSHRQEFSSKITTLEIGGHFGGQTSKIKDIQFSKAQTNRAVPASEREMTHWILSPPRLPIPSFRQKPSFRIGLWKNSGNRRPKWRPKCENRDSSILKTP